MLYAHNKTTYDKILPVLSSQQECALLQATGTGKTYVAMELLDTLFKDMKVLWVVPNLAIQQAIELYSEWEYPNVDFILYGNLNKVSLRMYTVIILDELHRSGAPTWYRKVLEARKHVFYLFGMSATPYRFLDNKRDMAKEIFGNNVVYGPDIAYAVDNKILPEFDYVAILTESFEVGKEYNSRKRVKHLDLSEPQIVQRAQKYIRPENKKWVAFYPDKSTLLSADKDLLAWYGDSAHIYEIHSGQSKKTAHEQLELFNQDTGLAILKSVDMVNEGVHLEGVTGVLLARTTVSGNVFLQQIGRALSASNKTVRPVIIDPVGNYNNIKVLAASLSQVNVVKDPHRGGKISTKETLGVSQIYISYDDTLLELNEVLAKVNNIWSDTEDAILRKYYTLEGGEVYRRLIDKTKEQCLRRARVLGLTKNRRWTTEEDAILSKHYYLERDDVWRRLPGRSQTSIEARASKLGLLPTWLPEEDLLLMKRWDELGLAIGDLLPRHRLVEVAQRAKKLGLV